MRDYRDMDGQFAETPSEKRERLRARRQERDMTCDPVNGCPADVHNLFCGYPDCEKGRRERARSIGDVGGRTGEAENLPPLSNLTDDEIAAIGRECGLGALADYLNDDQWNHVEPMLLAFARAIAKAERRS